MKKILPDQIWLWTIISWLQHTASCEANICKKVIVHVQY